MTIEKTFNYVSGSFYYTSTTQKMMIRRINTIGATIRAFDWEVSFLPETSRFEHEREVVGIMESLARAEELVHNTLSE